MTLSCASERNITICGTILKDSKTRGRIDVFGFVNKKEHQDVYYVLEWIMMYFLPLSEIDNELTRSILNVGPVSSKSLQKYVMSLVPQVERHLSDLIPNLFAIVLDGWTICSTNYMALFASFIDECGGTSYLKADANTVNNVDFERGVHISIDCD